MQRPNRNTLLGAGTLAILVAGLIAVALRSADDGASSVSPSTETTAAQGPANASADGSTSLPPASAAPEAPGSAETPSAPTGEGSSDPDPAAAASSCDDDPSRCSNADGLRVAAGRLEAAALKAPEDLDPALPSVVIMSEPRQADGTPAPLGADVASVNVVAVIENRSDGSIALAEPPVALDVFRDGAHLATYSYDADPGALPAGEQFTATFDVPIDGDGTYVWQARIDYR